jgi:hypothetical protein
MKKYIFLLLTSSQSYAQSRFDKPSQQHNANIVVIEGSQRQDQDTHQPLDKEFLERMGKELHEEKRRENINKIARLKELYSNAPSYPEKLLDGTHTVEITDGLYFIATAKVWIEKNKIVSLDITKFMEYKATFSTQIIKGKATAKFDIKNDSYFDIYFIKDIYE